MCTHVSFFLLCTVSYDTCSVSLRLHFLSVGTGRNVGRPKAKERRSEYGRHLTEEKKEEGCTLLLSDQRIFLLPPMLTFDAPLKFGTPRVHRWYMYVYDGIDPHTQYSRTIHIQQRFFPLSEK